MFLIMVTYLKQKTYKHIKKQRIFCIFLVTTSITNGQDKGKLFLNSSNVIFNYNYMMRRYLMYYNITFDVIFY